MTKTVPAGRDLTLDLARVVCVVLVVFVHILFTGVGRADDGALLIERTVEYTSWFDTVSWVFNIMPLFFVVGGYAARAGWVSAQRRGEGVDGFVRNRLWRLARPALVLMVFFAIALSGVKIFAPGLAPLVDTIAIGVGSPLWFLAAYLLVQALAPAMIRWHERKRWVPIIVLGVAALAVDVFVQKVVTEAWGMPRIDVTTYDAGSDLFGIPNILFVWLLAQQIGFWLYDGWFRDRAWWQLVVLVAGGYAVLWVLVTVVPYSSSMIRNQWPPTVLMDVLAVVQAATLTLLHRPLTALMATKPAQAVVFVIGSRLMTIYLWHLPVIMVVTGIQLLLPLPMPEPGNAVWWWTRPLFLIVVLAAVWALSLLIGRFEVGPAPGEPRFPGRGTTVLAVVLFILPFIGITVYGLDAGFALVAVVCTSVALYLTSPRPPVTTLA